LSKVKVELRIGHESTEGKYRYYYYCYYYYYYYYYSFFNLPVRWGEWLTPLPGQFIPGNEPSFVV
jgi:hypothetical protein